VLNGGVQALERQTFGKDSIHARWRCLPSMRLKPVTRAHPGSALGGAYPNGPGELEVYVPGKFRADKTIPHLCMPSDAGTEARRRGGVARFSVDAETCL